MGRLENIIARNQRRSRPRERLVVSLVFGAVVLLILALMMFTDLGLPAGAARTSGPPPAPDPRGKHVDDILLRTPPAARPAR